MKWFKGIIIAKDPDAVLNWKWNWSDWLGTGDTITGKTVTAETGITVDSDTINGDGVDVVLSGGTTGSSYDVTVNIETSAGLQDDRTVTFEVSQQ